MRVPVWLPALLGFLTAVGSISIDMYLPAFPTIAHELGDVRGGAQMTLAAFFIGLAFGQLILGPLADRMGRKAPLVVGMTLYTLATVGCALSTGLVSFSVYRFLAAVGGASSMVVPRAVVRDLATGPNAARMMAQLMLVMGVSPILAPALGGFVLHWAGWRSIFWVQAVYGVINLSLVILLLPDTLPKDMRVRHGLISVAKRYVQVARDRSFLPAALTVAFASATLFAYLGGSPLVFETGFHVSPVLYGCIFGLNGCGLILASQLNGRLFASRFGIDRTLTVAVFAMLAGTVYLSVIAVLGLAGLVPTLIGLFICIASLGCIFPNGTVAVMSRQHANAGVASALTGTLQFSIGAVSGMMVGELSDASPRAMAVCMLIAACCVTLCNHLRPRAVPGG
ncbi:MAG TPA: multidrug effflux MFS transporter [Acidisoma sp.]|jgi:DHA1 family bicyclomycin/chloramphenicol resistance-like MFS transporter|uniref:multidrug effflux MFS transporter n=1 Tax=Acidisoma sp. TaxID=1872115 RepID=UPI002BE6FE83|nr:multidrug effflux MFS transporter [Acidisoma sp.]HTI03183.1 multidrug effflux MFS transporter [Acidisoma sp.]